MGDLSQHVLLNLCYMLQNGLVLCDDLNKRALPGIERFGDLVDVHNVWPITFVEQWSLSELTVEALCERKFGSGGPFHADTPGPWKDSRKVR